MAGEEGRAVTAEVDELTELAYEGSGVPLTTIPVAGTPGRAYTPLLEPGAEPLASGEIRVTILGSGDPFVRASQAPASVLIEVGNEEGELFFFDLGSGSLANFNGLQQAVDMAGRSSPSTAWSWPCSSSPGPRSAT